MIDARDRRLAHHAQTATMAALSAIAILWAVMSLTYPFGWDQGLFAWAGNVVAHGGLPYRDAWDVKGPLVHYIYAFAQLAFGVHLWSIRIVDLAFLTTAALAIMRVMTVLIDRRTARWSALFFVLWYASHSFWHTAQPDGWAGMMVMVAAAPVVGAGRPRAAHFVALGVTIGLATLTKPLHAAMLLPPFAVVFFADTTARRLRATAALLGGWLAPLALTALWFAANGALGELVRVHLRDAAYYAAATGSGRLQGIVNDLLTRRVLSVGLPLGVYGAWVLWKLDRTAAILFGGWAAIAIGIVIAQDRFFAYHWLPFLPPAVVLGAVGARELRKQVPIFAALLVGVLFVHAVAPIGLEEARFASWIAGRSSRDAYYDGYGPEPGSDIRAANWLRQQPPGDVFLFGWNAAVPWIADRHVVSRFGYSLPLLLNGAPGVRAKYRDEALAAIDTERPRYVIVGVQSERIMGVAMSLADFPELAARINQRYRERARFGTLILYEASY